jgi:hypothetical protein
MPTVAIHDLLTVDPGLIRINEGYGYMRAADVLGGIKPESARSQEVDAITMLRAQMWRKECELFGRPIPTAPDETAGANPAMYPALLTDAARLRGLVANRQSAGGALPPEAARWGTTWEAHPWLADTDGPMTALSPGPDRLVVLGAASDGRAMHARWSPSDTWWHGWDGVAYGRTAPGGWVTAVHDGQDTWAFCVDPSGAVVQSYLRSTGVWSMWEPLSAQTTGGEFATAPGAPVHAVSCTPGQINVFYANGAGHVLTGTGHGGGWGSFTRIVGGSTRGAGHVTGVSRRDGQLDVFVVAPSGEVTTASWNSGQGWAGWWVIPGMTAVPGTYIGAVSKERDHLDLLAADDEGHVRHASWQGGGWVSWSPVLGGATAPGGFVTAVSRRVDLIDAFTVGTDGRIYTAAWAPPPAPGWMGWWPIGSPGARIDRPVWAVSRSLDKLDVFSTSVDHVVRQAAWEPGGSWKGPWAINEHWNPD